MGKLSTSKRDEVTAVISAFGVILGIITATLSLVTFLASRYPDEMVSRLEKIIAIDFGPIPAIAGAILAMAFSMLAANVMLVLKTRRKQRDAYFELHLDYAARAESELKFRAKELAHLLEEIERMKVNYTTNSIAPPSEREKIAQELENMQARVGKRKEALEKAGNLR